MSLGVPPLLHLSANNSGFCELNEIEDLANRQGPRPDVHPMLLKLVNNGESYGVKKKPLEDTVDARGVAKVGGVEPTTATRSGIPRPKPSCAPVFCQEAKQGSVPKAREEDMLGSTWSNRLKLEKSRTKKVESRRQEAQRATAVLLEKQKGAWELRRYGTIALLSHCSSEPIQQVIKHMACGADTAEDRLRIGRGAVAV